MTTLRLAAAAAILLAGSASAGADPVTYAGTLDGLDIVVELTGDPAIGDKPLAGRYFYRDKGVDIPLNAATHGDGRLVLKEQAPCSPQTCIDGKPAPVAAEWRLTVKDAGETLEGEWSDAPARPLKLRRVATRKVDGPQPQTPYDLYDFSDRAFREAPITMEASPYDFLRFDIALEPGEVLGWPGAVFRFVSDPRTKILRQRVLELPDGVDISAANRALTEHHWRDSRAALACMALQYAGFSEDGVWNPHVGGTLGGYDETVSIVTALTARLMSWREAGSIYCGGAHPTNYSNVYTVDVANGGLIDLAAMFVDAADGRAGPTLAAFISERRAKPSDQPGIEFEAECGIDELIPDHLAASLWRENDDLILVFGLQDLPHAIHACGGDDLLEVPVAEAMPLLTPAFAALVRR